MANTANFGWETPDDTDLVKDGALAMRTLGNAIDTSMVDLKGGTTGQVLSKNSNTNMDFVWVTSDDANAIQNAIVDAKGDLITATAADTPARLAVGANERRLVADSGETTGLKWVADTTNYAIAAKGDLLAGSAADTVAALTVGTDGHVLTADSSTATGLKWAAAASGGGDFVRITTNTFTAQSSIILTDCFTSTYKHYFYVLDCVTSTNINVRTRLRASGSDYTTADQGHAYPYQLWGNTVTGVGVTNETSVIDLAPNTKLAVSGFIYLPFESLTTHATFQWTSTASSGTWAYKANNANSYTSLSITTSSGTITGEVSIYGIKRA
jgi:hypothetical protein